MEIQRIKIEGERKKALDSYMGEILPNEIGWEMLMPVVEKIKKEGYPVNIYQSHIQNTCEIIDLKTKNYLFRRSTTLSDIEPVFNCVSDYCISINKGETIKEKQL